MGEYENGGYVTRAELMAHLRPLRDELHEIKGDVKSLLSSQAGRSALSAWQRFWLGTVGLTLLGAIVTIWIVTRHHG